MAVQLKPSNADYRLNLGNLPVKKGNIDDREEASAACRSAANSPNFSLVPHPALADIFQESGTIEEAAAVYRQVIPLDPENADHHFWIRNFYEGKGYLEEATHLYRETGKLETINFTSTF